ncbi:GNAT family N-acetyltransferase [Rheinheimera baltica]|uniref:GNAT family N-acetyltransferase n=1 Tax=Rheinheimera baltica TaxID=67576 RepID=UPI00273E1704|nr:GNAT family N-acetyltransferase [Rheinheimera baltica]MDP5141770.1 GNAT family N-acetyltransferase [Rheinheimera baltica]MDP5150249.1 GNAT family N-acetyltransferase [Rheinheimera baltica]MDP5189443.1 GNAT family N-acetyltransferase [Rheinheimera baltica]
MITEQSTVELERLKAVLLSADELKLAASILYQSYYDDPLFMEIFRAEKPDYEQRLRAAIREELNTFWQAQQPMVGLFLGEQLYGVACVIEPDSGIGAGRLWHWRLKMLLTAGYVSTKQLLDKEQKIHAAMPAERYHMLAFIAVLPKQQHLGLGHYLIHAVDSIVDKDQSSAGIGVFVTLDKYRAFFADDKYQVVSELAFNTVKGSLMFRPRQQLSK